jgi:hypothetical protein
VPTTSPRRRLLASTAALGALAAVLAGCASSEQPATSPAATPAATTTAAAKPAPTPSGAASTSTLGLTCDDLLPGTVLDGLAPQFTPVPSYQPTTGSYAAQITSFGGVACSWTDAAGDTLDLAVAKPTRDQLTTAETGIGNSGTKIDSFGSDVSAWTANSGGTFSGDFEVFPASGFWISTTSDLYEGPDSAKAKTVIEYVLQALPAG